MNTKTNRTFLLIFISFLVSCTAQKNVISTVGMGFSNNSVNAVKFRKNALTTHKDTQFIAYYDQDSYLILGKRNLKSKNWEIQKTIYKGNTKDAHNAISIAVDGAGFLHVSWDHHDTKLRYTKSKMPLGLDLEDEKIMIGTDENKVTYPEFHNLPNGNLIFLYRSGASGRGNMVLNNYDIKTQKWSRLQNNLLDGQNKRSAYWQASVDNFGTIHLSWVWRESWDVSTNHDLCYARSKDGGQSWETATNKKYKLPITVDNAEIVWKIAQKSNLINQTAMTNDAAGNPYIASYWNENAITQYQVVYLENGIWKKTNTAFRKTPFVLGGGGTKKIPIARPDIFISEATATKKIHLLFRDEERNNKISMASCQLNLLNWKITDLNEMTVGQWEPNFDIALWKTQKKLHIFAQNVSQVDGEGIDQKDPTAVGVLEINNLELKK